MKLFRTHLKELSSKTLASYNNKASDSISHGKWKGKMSEKKALKRVEGINKSADKVMAKEELQLEGDPIVTKKILHPGVGNPAPKGTIAYQKKHKLGVYAKGFMDGLNKKKPVKESYTDDHAQAHELILHADNDAQLHRSSHQPIIANLKKKVKKGVYDSGKATKLWGYHADRAAQSYAKEHGDKHTPWHKMFTPAVRKAAAAHWEQHHRDELHEEFTPEEFELIESMTDEELDLLCEGNISHKAAHDFLTKGSRKSYNDGTDSDGGIWGNKKFSIQGPTYKVPNHAGSAKMSYAKKKAKPFRDAAVTGSRRDFANEAAEIKRGISPIVKKVRPATSCKHCDDMMTRDMKSGMTGREAHEIAQQAHNHGHKVDESFKVGDRAVFKSKSVPGHIMNGKQVEVHSVYPNGKLGVRTTEVHGKELGFQHAGVFDYNHTKPEDLKRLKEEAINESPIDGVKKGAFHTWLGKSPGAKITSADIKRGLAAGGHAAKMANFARNAKKWHHEEVEHIDESWGHKTQSFKDFKEVAQQFAHENSSDGKVHYISSLVGPGVKKWHQTSTAIKSHLTGRMIHGGVFNHDGESGSEKGGGQHLVGFNPINHGRGLEEAATLAGKGSPHLAKLKKQYDENEDNNDHSTNALLLAKHFGTDQEHATAKKHLADRDRLGYGSHEGSQFQADMSKKYYHKLTAGPLRLPHQMNLGLHKEEVNRVYDSATGEWLTELSRVKLNNYRNASGSQLSSYMYGSDKVHAQSPLSNGRKAANRVKGFARATDKLRAKDKR